MSILCKPTHDYRLPTTDYTIASFAQKIIEFNTKLHYSGALPKGFAVLNPFFDNPETMEVMKKFYGKFYNDNRRRKFIIGINPSRHGAGLTGVPFTDTKRLEMYCGIKMKSAYSHEVSSVFIYDVIKAYGGVKKFYSDFYINSPFPLAIIRESANGNWTNANYYDDRKLTDLVTDFMAQSMFHHFSLGLQTDEVYVLGKKNAVFLKRLNEKFHFFQNMIVLDHPRFIQQYRFKQRDVFIDSYLVALAGK